MTRSRVSPAPFFIKRFRFSVVLPQSKVCVHSCSLCMPQAKTQHPRKLCVRLCILHNRNARHGGVDCLSHGLCARLAAVRMAVDTAACGKHDVGPDCLDNFLNRQLRGAAGAGVHHGSDVPPRLGEELEATVEQLIADGELAERMTVDLEVAARKARRPDADFQLSRPAGPAHLQASGR